MSEADLSIEITQAYLGKDFDFIESAEKYFPLNAFSLVSDVLDVTFIVMRKHNIEITFDNVVDVHNVKLKIKGFEQFQENTNKFVRLAKSFSEMDVIPEQKLLMFIRLAYDILQGSVKYIIDNPLNHQIVLKDYTKNRSKKALDKQHYKKRQLINYAKQLFEEAKNKNSKISAYGFSNDDKNIDKLEKFAKENDINWGKDEDKNRNLYNWLRSKKIRKIPYNPYIS